MITADDVAGVVLAQLVAQAGYATALPGKAWFDRGPDVPDGYPYGVFKVDAADATLTTGALYVQVWTARLAVYVQMGASGNNSQTVQQLLNTALVGTSAAAALRVLALRNASEKVVGSRPKPGESRYARELREGRDVFSCGLTVDLIFQGDRSVP